MLLHKDSLQGLFMVDAIMLSSLYLFYCKLQLLNGVMFLRCHVFKPKVKSLFLYYRLQNDNRGRVS